MINVCIPTLNSYNTLVDCVKSINNSTLKVDCIYILDNGGRLDINSFERSDNIRLFKQERNLGVAASWNWFSDNVSELRIISNDDVVFHPDCIEEMVKSYREDRLIFPMGTSNGNAFSCFTLPQNIVNAVGKFDEKISPRYAYFEDNDYHRRMVLKGFDIAPCNGIIMHSGSSTMKHYDSNTLKRHHEKFKLAELNYIKKWGGKPGHETFAEPVEL